MFGGEIPLATSGECTAGAKRPKGNMRDDPCSLHGFVRKQYASKTQWIIVSYDIMISIEIASGVAYS